MRATHTTTQVTAYQIEQQKQADHIARHSASKEKEMAARREVGRGCLSGCLRG